MRGEQLDLFGDRHVGLEDARRALAEGRVRDACGELEWLRRRHADDAEIAAELTLVRALVVRLAEIDGMPAGDRAAALAVLARTAAASARPWLLRRAAVELRRSSGPSALLDGRPASALLVEAGDPHAAWAVAAEAVADSPRALFLAHLADIEHRVGQRSRARARYREALALDPFDIDWDELADDEVKALPDVTRTELDLDDGVAWAAPVGVVLKVLPLGESPPTSTPDEPLSAPLRRAALDRARSFLQALLDATHGRGPLVIDARRRMRALAPQLLAEYLATR